LSFFPSLPLPQGCASLTSLICLQCFPPCSALHQDPTLQCNRSLWFHCLHHHSCPLSWEVGCAVCTCSLTSSSFVGFQSTVCSFWGWMTWWLHRPLSRLGTYSHSVPLPLNLLGFFLRCFYGLLFLILKILLFFMIFLSSPFILFLPTEQFYLF
jgi:hypothetical protein